MQIDLNYSINGLFTTFLPNTESGQKAWREIARHTEGTGKIFTFHLKSTLKQLKAAGLVVKKTKELSEKQKEKEFTKIFKEMDALRI
jgi:DNA-binding HxlR family transcriptional regulator